ncbi:hypothetical protein GCM10023238_10430 [Streptomyces heliomycini]
MHCGRPQAEYDRHRAYLESRIAAHDTRRDHFIHQVAPAALDHLHSGNDPDEVLRALPGSTRPGAICRSTRSGCCGRCSRSSTTKENLRDSAQRSFVSIARRVQAIVHQQAKELREMEEDHGRNPEVFDDLLRIDHGTALIGRLADSISVLGGGRPDASGPSPSRSTACAARRHVPHPRVRRIDLRSIAKVNIKGIHVEPVIHAAANSSTTPPATRRRPPR